MRLRRVSEGEGARPDLAPSRQGGRQSAARMSDARLWAAVGLVGLATVLGAVLMGRGGDTVLVLQADRDLAAGSTPTAVSTVAVPRELAEGYVTADSQAGDSDLSGVLQWPVAAGTLIPVAAMTTETETLVRGVTIPVDPLHAPADLAAGDLVDVWATPTALGGTTPGALPGDLDGTDGGPSLVLARVPVTAVSTEGVGFGGGWGVELAVPEGDVARAVAAGRSAVIDLVTVPATQVAS